MKPVDVFASDGKLASVIRTLLNPGVQNRLKFAMAAVQQFKIGRIRKADNTLNQKRRNIFDTKTNCEKATMEYSIEISSNTVRNVRRTCQLEKEER